MIEPAEPNDGRSRADPAIHGIVLAAGTSDRFGDRNKLLATVGGEPIIRRAVRTLAEASLEGVTVVLGHEADRVRAVLADLDVTFVTATGEGQGGSVAAGVETVREAGADAALIALGDMPAVSTATVERLVDTYRAGGGSALAAGYDGQRGNPVLFDGSHFGSLALLDGDCGGRNVLLSATDAALVETGDPGVLQDIDRPTDV
ncbi:NTP transferase domain-containing protein [Natronoarchaeum sp. GCM10025321]|uniref:nucleotidyltransferase family protein n=1 Tax=Natronoarchaeum sp. GCM10025321 TaxID=3252684 RepID=UPI003611B3D0